MASVSSSASRVWTIDRPVELARERELRGERAPLEVARRVVVVRIETALANRDRAAPNEIADRVDVASGIEVGRVVRVDAGREEHEAWMRRRDVAARAPPRRSTRQCTRLHQRPRRGRSR